MGWKTPEYSKNQIIKAGKNIRDFAPGTVESSEALNVIDNWRAAHAYPLQVIYCHLKRNNNKSNFIVAQRLKRLDEIIKD